MTQATPEWVVPVTAIFILQTVTSFLIRFVPIIAPAITQDYGWNGSTIGYLTATTTFGGLIILMGGAPLLKAVGGIRALQIGLLFGAASMALFLYPFLAAAIIACFIMGLSNGAATPAGSEILQRFSPPDKRNLIFSIKQAGVPLGGVVAALALPPIVELAGWRAALLTAAVLVIVTTGLTWPLRASIDRPSSQKRVLRMPRLTSLASLAVPLRSLALGPGLMKIAMVGGLFAVAQNSWFTFTVIYLVESHGFSLGLAGMIFAIMQAGGVFGRVALGWVADQAGSATKTLAVTAIVSATSTILLGLSNSAWPLWALAALAFIAGCSVSSWNGVQIAEVARRSPPHLIAETAAGSSVLVSIANMAVPAAFAAFVTITGRYDYAFVCAGLCTLLSIAFLPSNELPDRPGAGPAATGA